MLVQRAESHTSASRFVRLHGLTEPTHRRRKCLGTGSDVETQLARRHYPNTCRYYDTSAGKTPQPIFTTDQRKHLDENTCQCARPAEKQNEINEKAKNKSPDSLPKHRAADKMIAGISCLQARSVDNIFTTTSLSQLASSIKACNLTAGVTCAGADGGTLSDEKKVKA